jgi:hypothetical protein
MLSRREIAALNNYFYESRVAGRFNPHAAGLGWAAFELCRHPKVDNLTDDVRRQSCCFSARLQKKEVVSLGL